jgi:hypothetical protein
MKFGVNRVRLHVSNPLKRWRIILCGSEILPKKRPNALSFTPSSLTLHFFPVSETPRVVPGAPLTEIAKGHGDFEIVLQRH